MIQKQVKGKAVTSTREAVVRPGLGACASCGHTLGVHSKETTPAEICFFVSLLKSELFNIRV